MDTISPSWSILIFLAIVIVHGVLYSFGAAIQSISESDLEDKEDDSRTSKVRQMLEDSSKFTNALHIITIVMNVIVGAIIIESLGNYINDKIGLNDEFLASVLVLFVLLIILVVIGVYVPKKMAINKPVKYVYNYIRVVRAIMIVMTPITFLGTAMAGLIVRLIGGNPNAQEDVVTEEEIITMVNEGHEQGVFLASEAEMINNIIEFGDKTAGDIMTHRKNIIAIDASMTFEAAWHMMLEENVSRFPVYDEEIDNIIGILHYRDAAKAYENVEKRKLTVMAFKDILYDAYLIPETRNIDTLFAEMQTNKQHMAIVVDEYGQTAGVVTMEDILEEIVGNIFDEFDEEEEYITKQEDDTYMADGLTMLEDLEDTLSMKFECEEIETLNGFLVSQIGKIPSADEDIEVEYGGYIFKVLNIDDRIIGDVIIKKSRSTSDLNDQNE